MPSDSVDRHVDPAELGRDVGTSREFRDIRFPALEDFRAPPFVRPDTERPAKVIEHDGRVREGSCKLSQAANLRMVIPRVEAEAELADSRKAVAKLPRLVEISGPVGVRVSHL